jgi:EmrB/QacA subfamily drug resistance transporter
MIAPALPAININPRARFEILGAVLLALFLGALDQTIVGPVLPTIVSRLHGADYYTWVVTAYLVTSTATIPLYGKLSDYYGRRPILIIGIGLFLAGSTLSGLSQSMGELIAFRAIQGLGAGCLFPISLAVIGDLFTPAERGKYQGLFGAVFGIAFLVGPAIGGLLTDNLSWNWIFYVNIPVGLASLYLIVRLLPTVRQPNTHFSLDVAGLVLFLAAIVPTLVALTLAETGDWGDPAVLAWFALGAVSLVGFIIAEYRASDPMIPLGLFRNRTFAVASISSFFAIFGFSALIIFLPLWFQVVRHESTTASGYLLFPFLAGLIFSSVMAGQVASRTGRYKLQLVGSMAVMAFALALFSNLRGDTSYPVLWLWMLIAGLGVGPTMALFTVIVQNDVPFSALGTATSDLTLLRQIGTSVALTVSFTLFRNNLSWSLIHDSVVNAGAPAAAVPPAAPAGFDPGSLISVGGGGISSAISAVPAALQPTFLAGFNQAFSIAIADSAWIGVASAIIALVACLALVEKPLRAHFSEEHLAHAARQSGTELALEESASDASAAIA